MESERDGLEWRGADPLVSVIFGRNTCPAATIIDGVSASCIREIGEAHERLSHLTASGETFTDAQTVEAMRTAAAVQEQRLGRPGGEMTRS